MCACVFHPWGARASSATPWKWGEPWGLFFINVSDRTRVCVASRTSGALRHSIQQSCWYGPTWRVWRWSEGGGGVTFWPPHSLRNSFSCCAWQGFRHQTTISELMRWSIHYSVLYGLHRTDNIILASILTSWWKRAMEIHLSDVLFAVFNMARCRTWNFKAAAGKFGGHLISPHLQVQCIYCVEPEACLADIRSWPCGLASHRICFRLSIPAKSHSGHRRSCKEKRCDCVFVFGLQQWHSV